VTTTPDDRSRLAGAVDDLVADIMATPPDPDSIEMRLRETINAWLLARLAPATAAGAGEMAEALFTYRARVYQYAPLESAKELDDRFEAVLDAALSPTAPPAAGSREAIRRLAECTFRHQSRYETTGRPTCNDVIAHGRKHPEKYGDPLLTQLLTGDYGCTGCRIRALLDATPEATASAAGGARVEALEAALRKLARHHHHEKHVVGFGSRAALEDCDSPLCQEARAALAPPPPGVDRPEAS
jgi:hypothetical protein